MAKTNRFRTEVDARLAPVRLSPELRGRILAAAHGEAQPQRRQPPRLRRVLVTAVAAVLTLALGITVAASVFPGFELFIERMGEDWRNLVQPLSGISVSNGIQMEIVAAVHDDETAIVYLTMQDKKGGRVDEATELRGVQVQNGWGARAELVHFEKETATATYRLSWPSFEPLNGESVTLQVGSLLSGLEERVGIDTGYTLADVMEAQPNPSRYFLHDVSSYGLTHGADEETNQQIMEQLDARTMPVLLPWEEPVAVDGHEWLSVSGAGVLENRLHLQFQMDTTDQRYNRFNVDLDYPGKSEDNRLACAYISLGQRVEKNNEDFFPGEEYIFELPANTAPEDVRITADVASYATHVEGNWSASFTFEEEFSGLIIPVDIDLDTWHVHEIALSSIGISAAATGEFTFNSPMLELEVHMKDGTVMEYAGTGSFYGEEGFSQRYSFNRPIRLEDVDHILANGQIIRPPAGG